MEMEKVLPVMVYIHGGAFMFGILFISADFVDYAEPILDGVE